MYKYNNNLNNFLFKQDQFGITYVPLLLCHREKKNLLILIGFTCREIVLTYV